MVLDHSNSDGNGEKQLITDEFKRYYNLRVNGISDMSSERRERNGLFQ